MENKSRVTIGLECIELENECAVRLLDCIKKARIVKNKYSEIKVTIPMVATVEYNVETLPEEGK